jgi:hypothetical protein
VALLLRKVYSVAPWDPCFWGGQGTFSTNRKIVSDRAVAKNFFVTWNFFLGDFTPPVAYHFRGQKFFPDIPKFFVTLKNFSGHHQFSPFIKNFPNIPTSPTLTISDNVYNFPKISDNIDNFPTALHNRGAMPPPPHGATGSTVVYRPILQPSITSILRLEIQVFYPSM